MLVLCVGLQIGTFKFLSNSLIRKKISSISVLSVHHLFQFEERILLQYIGVLWPKVGTQKDLIRLFFTFSKFLQCPVPAIRSKELNEWKANCILRMIFSIFNRSNCMDFYGETNGFWARIPQPSFSRRQTDKESLLDFSCVNKLWV